MNRLMILMLIGIAPLYAQKQVNNGLNPKNPAYTLVFQEDLRFGGGEDDDDEYLWANTNSLISADAAGNMYISDQAANQVLAFDQTGKFLRVVAAAGEGPGEFQGAPWFQILLDGRAYAADVGVGGPPRFYQYDADLNHVGHLMRPTGGNPINGYFSPRGDHFICTWMKTDMQNQKMVFDYVVTDLELKPLITLSHSSESMPDFSNILDPKMWRKQLSQQFKQFISGSGAAAVDSKGRVYTAKPGVNYQITRYNADLSKADLVINRQYTPISYTEADIKGVVDNLVEHFHQIPVPGLKDVLNERLISAAIEDAQLPKKKSPILGMLTTDQDELLVIHDVKTATGQQVADIYSSDGVYLNRVTLTGRAFYNYMRSRPRMSFRNGFAYTTEVPAGGEDLQAVRYKVIRQ